MGLTVLCDGRSLNSNALPQRATLQKAVWKKKIYSVYVLGLHRYACPEIHGKS
jgi:hypothetical protein